MSDARPRGTPRLVIQFTMGSRSANSATPIANMKTTDHVAAMIDMNTTPAIRISQKGALGSEAGR